jgi:hypothetical protein
VTLVVLLMTAMKEGCRRQPEALWTDISLFLVAVRAHPLLITSIKVIIDSPSLALVGIPP